MENIDYNKIRKKKREVKVGNITVGGYSPISIQSMTNTDTNDIEATCSQLEELRRAGADIVRITVPDTAAAKSFGKIKERFPDFPLVADIQFDYRAAVESAMAGADKIRINPGNIGDADHIKAVIGVCSRKNIPIRIGVNSGSVEKTLLAKYGGPTADALVESALSHVKILEGSGFFNTIIAIKASNVPTTIAANRKLSAMCDYPIHIGITEAGTLSMGIVKSAAGIGTLLSEGIGDTIRLSLTADPLREITEGIKLLRALEIRPNPLNIISCPTCGRTKINLIELVNEFERRAVSEIKVTRPLTVALMGCAVNGPGEAREADIGIAGGHGEAVLFRRGEVIRKIPERDIIDTLIREIKAMTHNV